MYAGQGRAVQKLLAGDPSYPTGHRYDSMMRVAVKELNCIANPPLTYNDRQRADP